MSNGPIGIFGGTFNPIHNGHLRSALEIREALGLEKVLLVPAAQPPLREAPEVDADTRADLVECAIAGEPGLACDRRELSRQGPSYTFDTLAEFRAEYGAARSLCLVVGTDTLENLPRWHRWEELTDLAHMVIIARPGWQAPREGVVGRWLEQHLTTSAEALQHSPSGGVHTLALRQLPISATEIREMIAAGRSPRYLVPDAVWERIQQCGAYGAARHRREKHRIG